MIRKLEEGKPTINLSWHGILEGEFAIAAIGFLKADEACDQILRPYLTWDKDGEVPESEALQIAAVLMEAAAEVNRTVPGFIAKEEAP